MHEDSAADPVSEDLRADGSGDEAAAESAEARAREVLTAATALAAGDFVIHADHGLGRFEGLRSLDAGRRQEALEIAYRDGRLMVPVEDIGLLSRYGPPETAAKFDRLGGTAWATRRKRAVARIDAMARRLIGIAAERELADAPILEADRQEAERFAAGFAFTPTPDQASAIAAVLSDLASGKPMDRLVCGDVGSGKTEVALRAAFAAARAGAQVAVVCPTTLLARQHSETFRRRFDGFPVSIAHASRLAGGAGTGKVKDGLANGSVDIAVGTHTLLTGDVRFARLGLIIIDEEQRFGVQHKERLKRLSRGVHVLTLTATPIPRTMQLALSPVRDLSLILTPPAGRKPVETVVGTLDGATIAAALEREHARGGQSFYVCPRIADLQPVARRLAAGVPDLRVTSAHGEMPPGELDRIMQDFGERRFDVLLSTTIIESGLDLPDANTLVVHEAQRLGLAELYQLRGRVGRSPRQAYAYLTIPDDRDIGPTARRRLAVLEQLDTVGAGFGLASHDMDIRGAGNLVGEEQSGHIKEIGFDLFQRLLDRAVAALRGRGARDWSDVWVPRLVLDIDAALSAALSPETRIDLYWRLGQCETSAGLGEIEQEMAAAGPLDDATQSLLEIARLRLQCRAAAIAEINAGPKGLVLTPRPGRPFDAAAALRVAPVGPTRLKRDGRLSIAAATRNSADRLAAVQSVISAVAAKSSPTERQAVSRSVPSVRGSKGRAARASRCTG